MIILYFILILLLSFVLIKSSEIVVISLRRISKRSKAGVFALSAIIIAIGTSLPELFVGITSALEGSPNLALGNVLGANIANLSLVAGTSALFIKSVRVREGYLRREVGIALIAGVAPLLLILDHTLSRVDGLVLLAVYGVYTTSIFKTQYIRLAREPHLDDYFHKILRSIPVLDGHQSKEYGKLFLGLALLLWSSDMIVNLAQTIAQLLNIPLFLIGLVIVSIGTTLPEVAFSVKSLRDHEPSMFFGNLLGSIIANSTFVIGITALLSPIKIIAFHDYTVAVFFFILIFLIFWFFVKSKHRLDRWETVLLIILYLTFILAEFL